MRRLSPALALIAAGCATPAAQPAPAAPYVWVTFDRDSEIGSGAAGFADAARRRPLTVNDPVRIASISKLVVALGVMRLVEQGRLDLDRDVSDWLGWRLRNPAFPEEPVTLRMLLSHRSGLVDEVDYAIPFGSTVEQALGDPAAFDRQHRPGTYFRYANLNFPVIATAMEAASGERFDRLIHRLVLSPLGLDACFNWTTCSDSAIARAVVLTEPGGKVIRDDLQGIRPACPVLLPPGGESCDLDGYRLGSNGALFSPQGGLRASARDLAVVGRLLLNRGRHEGSAFLSEASMAELIGPHWRYDGANGETDKGFYCLYGLAVHSLPNPLCSDDPFGGERAMFGHAGDAYGVRSGLWVDPLSGRGIAFFATGLGEDPPRGRTSFRAVEEWLAARLQR
jgi:CubicO group peptidase (beta-lactamase class C family)